MADVKIQGSISVNTGNTEQAVEGVKKSVSGAATEMQKMQGNTGGLTGNFANLKKGLTDAVPAFGGVTQGIGQVNSALKVLLANPIVLILAAIAAALYMLVKAFTSTAEGADQLSFIFDGMKAVVLTVRDTILGVGKAIVKFFSGDFKGAMEEGSKAVNGFGDKCEEAFNRAYDASKQLDDIEDRMKELDVQRAKSNAAIKASKELLNDENASYEQKKKALAEVAKLEESTSKEELDLAAKKVEALKQKNKAQIENKTLSQEQIDEMQQAEIAFYNKQEELTGKQIQLQRQARTLDKQKADEDKAAHDEAVRRNKELQKAAEERQKEREKELKEIQKLETEKAKANREALIQQQKDEIAYGEQLAKDDQALEDAEQKRIANNEKTRLENKKKLAELAALSDPNSTQMKLAKVDADLQLELSKLAEGDIQRQILMKKAADESVKIKAEEVEAKRQLDELEFQNKMANINAIGGAVSGLSNLIGQETAVGKGIAVAAATIDTFQSASTVFRQAAKNPITVVNPAYPYLMALPAVLGGIGRVKQILAVKVPRGGAASGGSAPATPTAPVLPQAQSTRLDQTSVNAIGNAAGGGTVRAYVTETDLNNSRERDLRLQKAASIG